MNVGNAYSSYWAPVINLAREPRWGRNIETPGEVSALEGQLESPFLAISNGWLAGDWAGRGAESCCVAAFLLLVIASATAVITVVRCTFRIRI